MESKARAQKVALNLSIAHDMKGPKGDLHLRQPGAKNFLAVVWWSNRTTQKSKASAHGGDVRQYDRPSRHCSGYSNTISATTT